MSRKNETHLHDPVKPFLKYRNEEIFNPSGLGGFQTTRNVRYVYLDTGSEERQGIKVILSPDLILGHQYSFERTKFVSWKC